MDEKELETVLTEESVETDENIEVETDAPEGDEVETESAEVEAESDEGETEAEEPKQVNRDAALAKRYRDAATSAKGELAITARALKELMQEYGIEPSEIAEKAKTDPKTLENIISGRGVENPVAAAEKAFIEQYNLVKPILAKTMQDDPDKYLQAFDWLTKTNQDVLDEFVSLEDNERVAFVMERGKEFYEDFAETQTVGGNSAALIRKLRAEIAELKGAKKPAKEPTSTPKTQVNLTTGAMPKPVKKESTGPLGDFF